MEIDDRVSLTLVCVGCRAEQVIRIPRKRGIPPGRHEWECFPCQAKRYGNPGGGHTTKCGTSRTRRGVGNEEPSDREGK